MKRTFGMIGIILAMSLVTLSQRRGASSPPGSNPPLAKTDAERKILAVLDEMVKSHRTYLSVPIEDGRALRLLTEAAGAKKVVEIGTLPATPAYGFALRSRGPQAT